ncbi:conserved hypothetical protein [Rhodococcus jostii RHA1]|uniref:Uncharacterized protein n=1 Tax=Rhodococcus jostii (strain RHA1) TaxID=101510 RepID=Q0SJI1_RHOJR|nr:conserved hypothetical protein [Rhodococcus jostii RHA1]
MTSAASGTATEGLIHFPFPFPRDRYRYSADIEPSGARVATAAGVGSERRVVIDDHHRAELAERARILSSDPRTPNHRACSSTTLRGMS